jgi:hypothetical protein
LSGAKIATFEEGVVNFDFAYFAIALTWVEANFIPQVRSQNLKLFWPYIATLSMALKKSSILGDLRKVMKIISSNECIDHTFPVTSYPTSL